MPNEGTGGVLDAKMIQDLLKPIIESVNTVSEGQKGLALEVQSIKEAAQKPPVKDPKEDPDPTDRDLESMSRKEFLAHITDGFGKLLDDKIKPVSDGIAGDKDKELEKTVNDAVKIATKDHKDFWEWKKEMGEELVKNPYLMPEDAYQLARLHSGEKATEMDKKFPSDEAVQKGKDEKEAKEKTPGFGGLTPTSGQTVESENMKFPEASDQAWSETASHLDK